MTVSKIRKIVVEGPDCSGKSTLVERLKNDLRWDSKSLHHLEGDQFARYLKEYANQEFIVFDRSHYSETVYSKMWRGGSPFSYSESNILDEITKENALTIFCIPSVRVLEERYKKRNFKQQISLPDLRKSYRLFKDELEKINPIIYRSESYEELDKIIAKVRGLLC